MAKARVGHLSVLLSLNAKSFSKRLASATKRIKKFGRGIARIGFGVAKFGVALSAVAVTGLTLMVRSSLKAIDATAKLADTIGATTEELSSLQHIAELTGVGTQGMNKAMTQFVRRLGEAKEGSGEAFDALQRMGLSAERLSKLPLSDALGEVSDKINALETSADKAQAAYRLFGRQGVALTKVLEFGSAGIRESRFEADKLGISFSRFEASKVEEGNDAITRLKAVFTGLANVIAIRVSPFLDALATKLTSIGTAGSGMRGIVTAGFEAIRDTVVFLVDAIQGGRAAFFDFRAAGLQAISSIVKAIAFLQEKIQVLAPFIKALAPSGTGGIIVGSAGGSDATRAFADSLEKDAGASALRSMQIRQQGLGARVGQKFDEIGSRAIQPQTAGGLPGFGPSAIGGVNVAQQMLFELQKISNNTTETESLAI